MVIRFLFVGILLAGLVGCANHYTVEAYSDPYGFFSGIWHGMIFPFSLLVSLFSWSLAIVNIEFLTDIEIIGRPNTGVFYYCGFFLGLCADAGASSQ